MFACWLTYGYFNIVSNKSQQKMTKKNHFFGHPERSEESLFYRRERKEIKNDNQTQSTLISADFQLYFYLSDIYVISIKK